jgi:hypothetical protein
MYDIIMKNFDSANTNVVTNQTYFIDKKCCSAVNGEPTIPYYYNEVSGTTSPFNLVNSGYICCKAENNKCGCLATCKWSLDSSKYVDIAGLKYLVFRTETYVDTLGVANIGNITVVAQDGCHCPKYQTIGVTVTDPFTNKLGVGCQLLPSALTNLNSSLNEIKTILENRISGVYACDEVNER